MKVKVTYEKIFDSKDFYAFADEADLVDLNYDSFCNDGISEFLFDCPEEFVNNLKFEEVNDDI